jgi:hypothetical protein
MIISLKIKGIRASDLTKNLNISGQNGLSIARCLYNRETKTFIVGSGN